MEPPEPQSNQKNDDSKPVEGLIHRKNLVDSIAADLARLAKSSRGDLAELRRMSHHDPGCPAFWKLSAKHFDENLSDLDIRRWSAIVAGMASTADIPGKRLPLGSALAAAGVSEARLLKLLRARSDALLDAVRVTAHQLSGAAVVVDWSDVARIVFNDGNPKGERARRKIAANYYRSLKSASEQTEKEN